MYLELIKTEAERRKIPFKRIAAGIGMSEGNLHRCVRENRIQAQDLENIAKILKVNISIFFDGQESAKIETHTSDHSGTSIYGDVSNIHNDNSCCDIKKDSNIDEKVALLEKHVAALESRIEDKDEIIRLLREKENK